MIDTFPIYFSKKNKTAEENATCFYLTILQYQSDD